MAMTSAQKMRAMRVRADAEGICRICCQVPRTRGTVCEPCYVYTLERRRIQRARSRGLVADLHEATGSADSVCPG